MGVEDMSLGEENGPIYRIFFKVLGGIRSIHIEFKNTERFEYSFEFELEFY